MERLGYLSQTIEEWAEFFLQTKEEQRTYIQQKFPVTKSSSS